MAQEQWKTGTVSVTNGSPTVTGVGTLWNTNVVAGAAFKLDLDGDATYVIASVDSDTQITLSANYAGATAGTQVYMIQRSFSTNRNYARPVQGDADLADILRELVIDKIDTDMQKARFKAIRKASVSGIAPSATADTYGTATDIDPSSGYDAIHPDYVQLNSGGIFGSETLTVRITATFSDATTASVTKTFTDVNTTDLALAELYDLLKEAVTITKFSVDCKSSIASSATTGGAKLGGFNQ